MCVRMRVEGTAVCGGLCGAVCGIAPSEWGLDLPVQAPKDEIKSPADVPQMSVDMIAQREPWRIIGIKARLVIDHYLPTER